MGVAMAGPIAQAMSGQQTPTATVPPPIPGAATYFLAVGGQRTGPFELQALASQAAAGTLTAQTLVWTQGMAQWTPAGQVPALAQIFANVPPPLPPNA
jgi:hypothetical protein